MINLYKINDNKFKSIYVSYNFTMPIIKEEITKTAVISNMFSECSKKYRTKNEMETYLASLYGTNFDINIEKLGDLYNLEFRVEVINKKYLPNKEDVLLDAIKFLYEIIYNPLMLENSKDEFEKKCVQNSKDFVEQKINEKKDEKLKYGVIKTEEILCKDSPFSTFVYGDINFIKDIDEKNLFNHYMKIINNSCITVILSGNLDGYENIDNEIKDIFKEKLTSTLTYEDLNKMLIKTISENEIEEVEEKADTYQSVICMGFKIEDSVDNDIYALNVFNGVFGATPSSKLFQNFREKESLAYTVRSRYYKYKNIIIVYAGIEPKNYKKAKKVMLKQLEDIQKGNVSKEEFNAAKMSMVADLKEWEDSKIAMAKYLLSNLIIGKEKEFEIKEFIKKLEKVTIEEVIEVSKKVKLKTIYFLGGAK